MDRLSNRKKGFTLVELSIVMALLAIVVTMTVTFTTLMSNRIERANKRNEVINDLANTELAVQTWLRHYDNIDYKFAIADEKKSLIAKGETGSKNAGKSFKMKLSDDGTQITCDGTGSRSVTYIRGLEFNIVEADTASNSSGRYIIQCIVKYEDPTSESEGYSTEKLIFTTHAHANIIQ